MSVSRSLIGTVFAALVGLVIAFSIVAITSILLKPNPSQSSDAGSGATIFRDRCISCHVVSPSAVSGFGPSLARIGYEAATRKTDMNAAEYILESILHPEAHRESGVSGHMPSGIAAGLSPKATRGLVAYVAGLGSTADAAEISSLAIDTQELRTRQREGASHELLARGQTLFFDTFRCSACHSIYDEPGSTLTAPSLAHASRLTPTYISNSIRQPSAVIAAGYGHVLVLTDEGKLFEGRLIGKNKDEVQILVHEINNAPEVVSVPRGAITRMTEEETSRMPPYDLSKDDEAAIVAFLSFLEAETTEP